MPKRKFCSLIFPVLKLSIQFRFVELYRDICKNLDYRVKKVKLLFVGFVCSCPLPALNAGWELEKCLC